MENNNSKSCSNLDVGRPIPGTQLCYYVVFDVFDPNQSVLEFSFHRQTDRQTPRKTTRHSHVTKSFKKVSG